MTKTIGFKFNPARFIIFVTGFIILWICSDYMIATFILRTGFVFSAARDILLPTICATPFATFTQLLKRD